MPSSLRGRGWEEVGHVKEEATTKARKAFVREAITKAMAEMEAIIIAAMETIKSSSLPTVKSRK